MMCILLDHNAQPNSELFRGRYQYRVHVKYPRLVDNSTGIELNT